MSSLISNNLFSILSWFLLTYIQLEQTNALEIVDGTASEDCTGNDDCIINCNTGICVTGSPMNCPSGSLYTCHVNCDYLNGCRQTTINWPSAGLGSISCNGENACRDTNFPIPDPNTPLTITCDQLSSCYQAEINCPTDANCIIECITTSACFGATINWPTNLNVNSTLTCNPTSACDGATEPPITPTYITASNTQDYHLDCVTDNQCESYVIECPADYGCFITCSAIASCKNMQVHWVQSQSHNITCATIAESCYGVHISNSDQDTPLTLNCQNDNMCSEATVDCPKNANCTILCDYNNGYSCVGITINGPNNHSLEVICDYSNSCRDSVIHAENTSNFAMGPCFTDQYVCVAISVYIPPNVNGNPVAEFYGGDNSFSGYDGGIYFYAINGFLDVLFTSYTGDYSYNEGYMYCGIGYEMSCPLDTTSGWKCVSSDTDCDAPVITMVPTTNTPTTSIPTQIPTVIPTSIPTDIPSKGPTSNPSLMPSLLPIIDPTKTPTLIPTSNPTNNPTQKPTRNPSLTHTTVDVSVITENTIDTTIGRTLQIGGKNSNDGSNSELIIALIVGISVAAILIIFVIIVCCFRKKRKKTRKDTNRKMSAVIGEDTTNTTVNITKVVSVSGNETDIDGNNNNGNNMTIQMVDTVQATGFNEYDDYDEPALPDDDNMDEGDDNIINTVDIDNERLLDAHKLTAGAIYDEYDPQMLPPPVPDVQTVTKGYINDDESSSQSSINDQVVIVTNNGSKNNPNDYKWIEQALKQCDNKEWEKYLFNFKKHKMTDARLNKITSDKSYLWETLIPEIGIRLDFEELWKQTQHN